MPQTHPARVEPATRGGAFGAYLAQMAKIPKLEILVLGGGSGFEILFLDGSRSLRSFSLCVFWLTLASSVLARDFLVYFSTYISMTAGH